MEKKLVLLGVAGSDSPLIQTFFEGSDKPPVKSVLVYLNRIGESPSINYRGITSLLDTPELVKANLEEWDKKHTGNIPLFLGPTVEHYEQAQQLADQGSTTRSLIDQWAADPTSRGF